MAVPRPPRYARQVTKSGWSTNPYAYANNDPLNVTDPLGLFSLGSVFSSAVHAVSHVVNGVKHVVHAIAGTVTRGADIIAGSVAHAFQAVHTVLDHVAAIASKAADRVVRTVREAATHVAHAVGDAVSRSVGIVKSTVTQAATWIKKHNQVIGKIGSFLSNAAGGLALAGLIIAPIPGLDALTPVLEGAAVAASLGALAAQGVAKAAGDQNITYGDLFGDALGVIPGGADAEDAAQGLKTASRLTDDAAAASHIPDDTVIVRGGQSDMPGPGELFSGAQGRTVDEAAAGVPHGTIRSTTAGDIRTNGGSVDYAPEFNERVGKTNYQHVDVRLGSDGNPFSESFPNPVPKRARFGFPDYPYDLWGPG